MTFVAGLDLGQSIDHAALVIGEARLHPLRLRLVLINRYPLRTSYAVILADVAAKLDGLGKPAALALDSRGPGKPCVDLLASWPGLALARLLAVSNTSGRVARREPSRNGDPAHLERWCVPKVTLLRCLSRLVKSGGLVVEDIPGAAALKSEFHQFGFRFTEQGNLKLDARSGHDDLVLATATMVWAAVTESMSNGDQLGANGGEI